MRWRVTAVAECIETAECPKPQKARGRCDAHYTAARRRGQFGLVEGGPAREHLAKLHDLGWTEEQIGEQSTLSRMGIGRIARRQNRRIRPESEALILAVPLVPPPGDTRRGVDSTGSRRRVQALAWMGWPAAEVAARAGTTRGTLQSEILPTRRISVRLARRIADVYDQLSMIEGPSAQTAAVARRLGFAPALAWDDDAIDGFVAAVAS